MKVWLKYIPTEKIVCSFTAPKGYSMRTLVDNWLRDNNITDTKNYKILYRNPFYRED